MPSKAQKTNETSGDGDSRLKVVIKLQDPVADQIKQQEFMKKT